MQRSTKLSRAAIFKLAIFTLAKIVLLAAASPQAVADKLAEVESDVDLSFPTVDHLKGQDLVELEEGDVLLFDVREPEEFAVSHIAGAIQIDPKLSGEEFLDQFGALLRQRKRAVFYCSVGVRSSEMAMKVKEALNEKEPISLHNLRGGIFRWHNQNLPLNQRSKATDYVHPYNWRWGRLVNRQDFISYKPVE